MIWENIVRRVVGSGRPRSIYNLAQGWTELSEELESLAGHITRLKEMTANDALSGDLRTPAPAAGKAWTGPAAEAFREHVANIAHDVSILVEPSSKVGGALERVADALCFGVSQTPVPVFRNGKLPGGINVQDIVDGILDKDIGTEFAERLHTDMEQAPRYYEDGGFKRRLDEDNRRRFVTRIERYNQNKEQWYTQNQVAANNAVNRMIVAYRDEFSNVAPIIPDGVVTGGQPPTGDDQGVDLDALGGGGTGLAGTAGAGLDALARPNALESGTAGPRSLGEGAKGLGGGGGLGGAGRLGIGAAGGALAGGMMPGMMSAGSPSGGAGRSPMPALTSGNRAVGSELPPGDDGQPDWSDDTSWARSEDDWGAGHSPDLPPSLLL